MAQVVAILGRGVIDPTQPVLLADELAAVRGDGMFETVSVRGGDPWQMDPHLARMAGSAEKLGITLPPLGQIRELATEAIAAFGNETEGALRIVCSRGPESGGAPTVWITLNPVPEAVKRARRDGLRVATRSIGYGVDTRGRSPWLLGGAKTLSYATTMAVQRHAVDTGFDDALWVSEDGWALEGPTSTLVWLDGETLYTVPADTGILVGTTAAFVLDRAGELGLRAAEARIKTRDLLSVDGAWLMGSVRGIASIVSLDGKQLPVPDFTADMQRLAGFPDPA